jgi:hypothetical protein
LPDSARLIVPRYLRLAIILSWFENEARLISLGLHNTFERVLWASRFGYPAKGRWEERADEPDARRSWARRFWLSFRKITRQSYEVMGLLRVANNMEASVVLNLEFENHNDGAIGVSLQKAADRAQA